MIQLIIFLLTSFLTARFLNKRKMRVAAALYVVMFAVLLCLLSFSLDIPWFRKALVSILGISQYHMMHVLSVGILGESFGGISVIVFIVLSIAVPLGISIYSLSKKVVYVLIKRAPYRKRSSIQFKKIENNIILCSHMNINRLYCRMLN